MRLCVERSLLRCECGDSTGEFFFSFSASEGTFKGHFPNHPILPGVFQLEMARLACERVTGRRLEIERIDRAKFSRPILPEEEIRLSVKIQSAEGVLHAYASFSVSGEQAGGASLVLRSRGTREHGTGRFLMRPQTLDETSVCP